MHDHGELSSHGDGGALHAPTFSDGDTPGLQTRPLPGTGYPHGCGFVEEMSQHSIAASADLPRSVDLVRLIHARRQAEMCPQRFRGAEAAWVVDCGNVCKAGYRLDAGDGRQAATDVRAPGRRILSRRGCAPGTTTICGHSMPEPARSQN